MDTQDASKSQEMRLRFSATHSAIESALSERKITGSCLREAVDNLTKLTEILAWAEKKDATILDFFIENNVVSLFPELLRRNAKLKSERDNDIKLIKSFSFMILNLKSKEVVNFIFSSQSFNQFLNFSFDFLDDEIVFFFVNFIKSISQQFDSFPLQIFFNQRNLDLPLFSSITRFTRHPDALVRATAFNVILTLLNCRLTSQTI